MKNRFLISALIGAAAVAAVAAPKAPKAAQAAAPKYIFYMIGDGMGWSHVTNAQLFMEDVLGCDSTLTMLSMPVASSARTH